MAGDFELHLQRSLDESYEAVVKVLKAGPQAWLPEFAQEAETVTAELAFDQAGGHVRRRVAVELGTVQLFAYGVTVRIQWKAAEHPNLYPRLEGHLRLERRQPTGCRLRFDVRYTPPAGRLGTSVDRALMHRVAESTVENFLDRVARRLVRGREEASVGRVDRSDDNTVMREELSRDEDQKPAP
jgi:hypothetical protein